MISMTFKQAFQSLLANPVRSFLTILGVIIGISSVVMFMALGAGLRQGIKDEVSSLGTNILFVISGKINGANGPVISTNLLSNDVLKVDDVSDLKQLPEVQSIAPMTIVGGVLRSDSKSDPSSFLIATEPSFLDVFTNLSIGKGRSFTSADNAAKARVIVLGSSAAQTLFGDTDPLDQTVAIGKEKFTVIGVTSVPASQSLVGGQDFSAMSFIPFDTETDITGAAKVFRIGIKIDPNADMTKAKQDVTNVLLKRHSSDDFSVVTQDDLLGVLGSVLNLLTSAVAAIAGISLVVAGIGIMNIMLVAVTERTREIGLRKAIGATNASVLIQFLVEAILLTLIGAVLAVALAAVASYLIGKYSPIHPIVTLNAVLLAVGVAAAVGVVFGIAPALRAAKLDPIQALRYE